MDLVASPLPPGIGNVYDINFEPETDAEKKLFKLQNELALSCLEQALHTADGKLFVREFKESGNARGVYQRLVATYNTGKTGCLKAEKIEAELQDMRLDVRQWKKGCQAFLTAWEHKICDLAELDPEAVTESKKWRWLRQAVLPHKTMEAAITNFDSLDKLARKMTPDDDGLGFQEMFNQLMDAATRHDKVTMDNVANQQRRIQEGKFQTVINKKGSKGSSDGKRLMLLLSGSIIHHKTGRSCLLRSGSRFLSNAWSLRARHDPNVRILLRPTLRNPRQLRLQHVLHQFLPQ